jgi:cytidylate kinase
MKAPICVIAIDGPAGSGKSTVAKLVAQKLGLFYIDTGAMYRALALKAKREGIAPTQEPEIIRLAQEMAIDLEYDPRTGNLKVRLDGEDVTQEIRQPAITEQVSYIARIKEVRDRMVQLQRRLAEGRRAILEGRDITTVVFPDAGKKFYLDAAPEERVERRYREMRQKNIDIAAEAVKRDIERRDRIDSTREHAPLRRAPDAFYIDTTRLSIEEVVNRVIEEIDRTP